MKEQYKQVCVWPGCVVKEPDNIDESVKVFEKTMKEQFDVRVKYLEEIDTLPDTKEDGSIVEDTGERTDLFFSVHEEDVGKFAIPRLKFGIRWIEDVLANGNYRSNIYPDHVFKYVTWNNENITFPEGC